MAQAETGQITRYLIQVKSLSVQGSVKCKQLILTQLIPHSRKYAIVSFKLCKEKLVPGLHKSSSRLGSELLNIHRKQNWFKRFGSTMLDNAAGLSMAMFSTKIVQNFVEVKEFGNLWGLLATRPVVSEETYEIISFGVEFFIALIVFTVTEHYVDEFKQYRNSTE